MLVKILMSYFSLQTSDCTTHHQYSWNELSNVVEEIVAKRELLVWPAESWMDLASVKTTRFVYQAC